MTQPIRRAMALGLRSLAVAGALMIATGLQAAPAPVEQHNSNSLWFENWTGLSNATLRVSSPDGTVNDIAAKSGTPVYNLPRTDVLDGIYRYELTAATDERAKIVNPKDNGRENEPTEQSVPYVLNGWFLVERGVIATPVAVKED